MQRYLPLAVVLIITGVLIFALDEFLREVIIQPLLYVSWIGVLILGSLHQSVFWGVLLVAALVLILRSLGGGPRLPTTVPEKRYQAQGAVRRWIGLIERSRRQRFARWNLAQSMRKLAQELLVPAERLRRERRNVSFEGRLPPEIDAYFNAKLPPAEAVPFWQRVQAKPAQPAHPLDLDPAVVVTFLEQETERLAGE